MLQDRGLRVALVTDGRMSGASGKVPAAIQVSPESACGGPLARVRDGDIIRLDATAGVLEVVIDEQEFHQREPLPGPGKENSTGMGRELFSLFRANALTAEEGGSPIQGTL